MINFKKQFLSIVGISCLVVMSCENEADQSPEVPLEVQIANDIPADPNAERGAPPSFTFYDLESGTVLTKSDSNSVQWDLAFSGTTILINGGTSGPGLGSAQLVEGIFDNLASAPADGYSVDGQNGFAIPTGSGNGWYNYTGGSVPINAILPIPGRVLMLTTGDGNYAKVEILSYYEGNPDPSSQAFIDQSSRSAARYYTFKFMVQPNGSINF